MLFSFGALLILCGLAIMAFGLHLFFMEYQKAAEHDAARILSHVSTVPADQVRIC
jgi:hypothetical protein